MKEMEVLEVPTSAERINPPGMVFLTILDGRLKDRRVVHGRPLNGRRITGLGALTLPARQALDAGGAVSI
jgi:hypothetical protein